MPFRQEPGRRRITINIDTVIADRAAAYARERGVGVEYIYETAVAELLELVNRDG